MRSVRFERFGQPDEVLEVQEVERPEPAAGEALVRLRARSINPSDLLTVRGQYGTLPHLPATPGLEGMGVVEMLGPDTPGPAVGQRVIPLGSGGLWQDYIVATATQLIPVPDTVPDASAAQFVVNPLTAWIMALEELDVQPGEWLLQTAATSTLGRVLLHIARLRGFRTINVVRRRDAVEELKEAGADEVICSADEDLVERVRQITGQTGVRAAIDAVGGALASEVTGALERNGTLVLYGALSNETIPLDAGRMIFKGLTVRGFWLSQWMRDAPPERRQAVIGAVLGALARGELVPPVEAAYDLSEIKEAVRHAERPGRKGKVLLVG